MAAVDITIQPTPNPNSLKFTLDKVLTQGRSQTFSSAEKAESNPLAKRLFAVEGVASVFFLNDFVTVTKVPGADWADLAPQLTKAIEEHYANEG